MQDIEEDLKDIVVRAVTTLSMVCDHAQSIDGQGFSKSTAGPGHEIAALGSNKWSPDFWDYAARLSSHHSRQLEKSGHLDPMDGERLRHAVGDTSVAAPDIPTHWIDLADIDGRRALVLSMPSDERLPKILKNLPADEVYRPAGVGRLWRVSERWAFAVEPFLPQFTNTGEGVFETVMSSSRTAAPEDRMIATDLPLVRFDSEKGEFRLQFAYDRELVSDIRKHGGRFEKGASWKDCTAFIPADRFGSEMVDRMLGGGLQAVLHSEAVQPLADARTKEPSAQALAATAAPQLVFDPPADGKLRVKMTKYVAEFVQAIKGVPGRIYDEGAWLIPASSEAASLLASRLQGISPEANDAADELWGLAGTFGNAVVPATQLSIEDVGGKFVNVTMSSYVAGWVDSIKCLPKGDRRYDAERKAWKVRKDSATFTELLERMQGTCSVEGNPAYFEAAVETVERFRESIDAEHGDANDGSGMRM